MIFIFNQINAQTIRNSIKRLSVNYRTIHHDFKFVLPRYKSRTQQNLTPPYLTVCAMLMLQIRIYGKNSCKLETSLNYKLQYSEIEPICQSKSEYNTLKGDVDVLNPNSIVRNNCIHQILKL